LPTHPTAEGGVLADSENTRQTNSLSHFRLRLRFRRGMKKATERSGGIPPAVRRGALAGRRCFRRNRSGIGVLGAGLDRAGIPRGRRRGVGVCPLHGAGRGAASPQAIKGRFTEKSRKPRTRQTRRTAPQRAPRRRLSAAQPRGLPPAPPASPQPLKNGDATLLLRHSRNANFREYHARLARENGVESARGRRSSRARRPCYLISRMLPYF